MVVSDRAVIGWQQRAARSRRGGAGVRSNGRLDNDRLSLRIDRQARPSRRVSSLRRLQPVGVRLSRLRFVFVAGASQFRWRYATELSARFAVSRWLSWLLFDGSRQAVPKRQQCNVEQGAKRTLQRAGPTKNRQSRRVDTLAKGAETSTRCITYFYTGMLGVAGGRVSGLAAGGAGWRIVADDYTRTLDRV